MSTLTTIRDLIQEIPVDQREQRLGNLERRLQQTVALLEVDVQRGGQVSSRGQFRRWKPVTLEQKRQSLTQLREALSRIHQNLENCQKHRETGRLLAAGQLASTVIGAVVPGAATAGTVVSAGLGAYRQHRAPQDRPDTPVLLQGLGVVDGTLHSLICDGSAAAVVNQVQQAIPAASAMPRFLLMAVVKKVGDFVESCSARLFGSNPARA